MGSFWTILPHLAALFLMGWIAVLAGKRRSTPGAGALIIVVIGQGAWISGYLIELHSDELMTKLFWDNMQVFGAIAWPLAGLSMALSLTGRNLPASRLSWGFLIGIMSLCPFLAFGEYLHLLTEGPFATPDSFWHDVIHERLRLVPGEPFAVLTYDFSSVTWVFMTLYFMILLAAKGLLAAHALMVHRSFRPQLGWGFLGLAFPFAGGILSLAEPAWVAHRDLSPYYFTLGDICLLMALKRYRFLALVPMARTRVLENMPQPLFVVDPERKLADLNAQGARLLGLEPSDALGKCITELMPELPSYPGNESVHQFEIQISDSIYTVTVFPVEYRGQQHGQAQLWRDITAQRRAERALEDRAQKLAKLNEEMEAFSYSISHDLRAPLRTMSGYASLVREDCHKCMEGELPEMLDAIERSANLMGRMIDALLNLSKLTRQTPERQSVDLSKLAESVCSDLRVTDPARTVECLIQPGLMVEGDPVLLRMLMENLLGNAFKYTGHQKNARISLGREFTDEGQAYVVRDNGVGFDSAMAELFLPFRRHHTEIEFPGLGIGLATCRRIVESHGGQIRAESKPGEGAAFFFTLGNESSSTFSDHEPISLEKS